MSHTELVAALGRAGSVWLAVDQGRKDGFSLMWLFIRDRLIKRFHALDGDTTIELGIEYWLFLQWSSVL